MLPRQVPCFKVIFRKCKQHKRSCGTPSNQKGGPICSICIQKHSQQKCEKVVPGNCMHQWSMNIMLNHATFCTCNLPILRRGRLGSRSQRSRGTHWMSEPVARDIPRRRGYSLECRRNTAWHGTPILVPRNTNTYKYNCMYIYIIVYLLVGAYILHTHILIIFHTFHCILYSGFILSFGCSQAPTAPTVTNAV